MRIKYKWRKLHDKYIVKYKLIFVKYFHNKYKGKYCWADCVAWSFSPYRFNPFKIDGINGCKKESITHSTGMCYCGSWKDGECFDLLPKEEQENIREQFLVIKPENLPF